MPIHPRYKKVLKAMTKQYCKGKLSYSKNEGMMTCPKAKSVFYATMKAKGIDYTKAPTSETIAFIEECMTWDIDAIVKWFEDENVGV